MEQSLSESFNDRLDFFQLVVFRTTRRGEGAVDGKVKVLMEFKEADSSNPGSNQ